MAEQIAQRLSESDIMSAEEVQAFLQSRNLVGADDEQLLSQLVEDGKLTAYQAKLISEDKGDSLVLGDYLVLDELGKGGMGIVFKAMHRRMERLVALKVLSPDVTESPEALQRFHREVKAAAKLSHQNIVTAHDAGEAKDTHYLVMEYVEGTDLSKLVKKRGPLPVNDAVSCILQAARGLEYAHGQGIIHRDIKPSNLLLDQSGTAKILDMGLARIETEGDAETASTELTGTGAVMGTIDFMSPEQALDTKHADQRSDIYSLGISLYYLLTGKPAYTGDSTMAKLLAHRENPIPALREVVADVPEPLDAIFQRMAAKKPEGRYQTMAEVVAALAPLCDAASAFSFSTVGGGTKQAIGHDDLTATASAAPLQDTDARTQAEPSATWWQRRTVQAAAGIAVVAAIIMFLVLFRSGSKQQFPVSGEGIWRVGIIVASSAGVS